MGNRVWFWLDCWCGDQSLKEAFLVLYDIATDQEALVESLSVWHHEEEKRSWDVQFHRALNDWELDAVMAFTHILLTHIPSSEVGDWMSWKLRTSREFEIQYFYCGLRASSFVIFPWKSIWGRSSQLII